MSSTQYPTFFTGLSGIVYPVRPQWMVAGVDYGVGYPTGQVFKNPLVDTLPTGATADTLNKLIRCNSTNNLTFDGWDFSVSGGYTLYVNGTTANTTVTNCNFLVGANAKTPIQSDLTAGNLTVANCLIDGAGTNTSLELVRAGAEASLVMKYCRVKGAFADSSHAGSTANVTGGNHNISFNLFESAMYDASSHSDHFQGLGYCQSAKFWFNTIYQPAVVSDGTPGNINAMIRWGDFTAGQSASNINVGYNSVVGVGTGHKTATGNNGMAINQIIQIGATLPSTIINPYIHDNFVDPTSLQNGFSGAVGNGTSGGVFANNVKLTDGTLFTTPF